MAENVLLVKVVSAFTKTKVSPNEVWLVSVVVRVTFIPMESLVVVVVARPSLP